MFLAIKLTQLPSKSDARRGVVVSSYLGSGTMGDPYGKHAQNCTKSHGTSPFLMGKLKAHHFEWEFMGFTRWK